MATISLYSRPELLRSGNQALRPAQFQLADSGLASGLGQVAKITANVALDLNQKAKKADDSSVLIDLGTKIAEKELELSKWQLENNSNEKIMQNGVSLWEMKTRETFSELSDEYNNMDVSPELRGTINAIISRAGNNAISSAWAGGIKQIGNNFDDKFNTALNDIAVNGKSDIAKLALQEAYNSKVLNEDQYNMRNQAIKFAENKFKLTQGITSAQTLVEAGVFDPTKYEQAKNIFKNLYKENIITDSELTSRISKIDNQIVYNDRWSKWELDAEENPGRELEKMVNDENISRSSSTEPNIPSEIVTPKSVRIDTDGLTPPPFNDPHFQPQTSYINPETGKYLDATTDAYVVVPIGSKIPLGTKVRVTNTESGQVVDAIVGDRGPTENGYGELSLFAAKQLGAWEDGMGNSAKQVPLKYEYNPTGDSGEYGWMKPVDRKRAQLILREKVKTNGIKEFNEIKDEIDIGEFSKFTQESEIKFNDTLANSNYMSGAMKDTLSLYRSSKAQKQIVNTPTVVADLKRQIADYAGAIKRAEESGEKYDSDQLEFVLLGNQIETLTDGFIQTELNQDLRNVTENRSKREEYTKLSPALKLLRSAVLDYKEPEMAPPKETGYLWWKKSLPAAEVFSEREVKDADGNKRVIRTPILKEMSETEKENRLKAAADIERELREKLKENPNINSTQLIEELKKNSIYTKYRNDQTAKFGAAVGTSTSATASTNNITNLINKVKMAKTRAEMQAIERDVRASRDSNLIQVWTNKNSTLAE